MQSLDGDLAIDNPDPEAEDETTGDDRGRERQRAGHQTRSFAKDLAFEYSRVSYPRIHLADELYIAST
jgi:hypothetical protein